jgi:hypothetical protein
MISTNEIIARLAIRNIQQVKDPNRRADVLEMVGNHLTADLASRTEILSAASVIRKAEELAEKLPQIIETTLND